MAAASTGPSRGARTRRLRRASAAAVAIGLTAMAANVAGAAQATPRPHPDASGIHAVFAEPSYAAGARAELRIWNPTVLTVQVFRAGRRSLRGDSLRGVAVSRPMRSPRRTALSLRVGNWPSGLYFARLSAPDGRIGFAPLIVRPRRLGASRVAVVLPTYTWQAYNFRDVDGDSVGDTWYASQAVHTVRLDRPFLDRGVPPHFRAYDAAFAGWLLRTRRRVDVLADDDLDRVPSGDILARRYDLIIFPGHEEYVTAHMYDVVERYRDLGGDLAFLSANNFFYRVERRRNMLHGRVRWRDLGRPEAALIGSQYVDWFQETFRNRPYRVVGTRHAPWLFAATGLRDGSRFGTFGIEIDARTSASPAGTRVLARIPHIFGHGKSAEMTYYETPRGARVFAAGVLNFSGAAWYPPVSQMLDNLWDRLAHPAPRTAACSGAAEAHDCFADGRPRTLAPLVSGAAGLQGGTLAPYGTRVHRSESGTEQPVGWSDSFLRLPAALETGRSGLLESLRPSTLTLPRAQVQHRVIRVATTLGHYPAPSQS